MVFGGEGSDQFCGSPSDPSVPPSGVSSCTAGVPPYGRMAGIVLSSPDVQAVFDLGNRLARADGPLRQAGAELYGPAPAPIARIRGRHRVRLLIKADKSVPLQQAVAAWLAGVRWKGDIRLSVDIDPQSFY